MAGIDIETLRADLTYPAIQSGVRQGLSIADIGAAIRASGLSISNARLSAFVQAERGIVAYGRNLRFLNRASRPNYDALPEALTAIRSEYSFAVEVRGSVSETGEPMSVVVTVSTNRKLTRQQIESAAMSAVTGAGERYGIDADRAVIQFGIRAGSLGRL